MDILAKRKQLLELRDKLVAQVNFVTGQLALLDELQALIPVADLAPDAE